MPAQRTEQILDFAERRMRKGGYGAVSFRDIAAAVGIKSASVHYHFPTKADLGKAVVERYTDRFVHGLGAPDAPEDTAADRIMRLADAYQAAYRQDLSTCLCTVLGAVATDLPPDTTTEVQGFYDRLLGWVDRALAGHETKLTSSTTVALLQGAMVLAIARNDPAPLEEARTILASLV